jgi:hypothetical protein
MMIHLRFVLVTLLLQTSSASAFATDSKGYFQDDCSGTTIHITKIDRPHGGQQLVLRLNTGHLHYWYYSEESLWWDAEGKLCSVDGKCEEATHARVWVNEEKTTNYKRISGKYEVELNGQRLEGQFVVKYRKYKPLPICL